MGSPPYSSRREPRADLQPNGPGFLGVFPAVSAAALRLPRRHSATRRLRARDPDVKVLMLTTCADDRSVIDAISDRSPPAGRDGTAQLPDGLIVRESEVLQVIAGGLSNGEIAAHLVASETRVKSHINHLFAKTVVRDRAQAVKYAYDDGLK